MNSPVVYITIVDEDGAILEQAHVRPTVQMNDKVGGNITPVELARHIIDQLGFKFEVEEK